MTDDVAMQSTESVSPVRTDPSPMPTPSPATGPSEDDELGAVFDRVTADGNPDAEPKPEATGGELPARGPDGKFVKADGDPPAPPHQAGDESPENADPARDSNEGEEEATAEASPDGPPAHLPQAIKSEWQNIPEGARKEMARLTQEWDRKFGEIGGQLRNLETVKPIADKLTQATQNFPQFQGMSPDQLADGAVQLAAVQAALEQNPVETILQVAQQYGGLPHVHQRLTGQEMPQDAADAQAMRAQIAQLERQLQQAQSSTPDLVQTQVSQALEAQRTEQAIEAFAQSKPYFGEVEPLMPQFVTIAKEMQPEASITDVLEAAYDMAVNALPEVRAKAQAASEAKKATAAAGDPERAEKAKRAASINVKSTSNGKVRTPSEEEAMAAAYDRMMAS